MLMMRDLISEGGKGGTLIFDLTEILQFTISYEIKMKMHFAWIEIWDLMRQWTRVHLSERVDDELQGTDDEVGDFAFVVFGFWLLIACVALLLGLWHSTGELLHVLAVNVVIVPVVQLWLWLDVVFVLGVALLCIASLRIQASSRLSETVTRRRER
jgi:hypothetical protein